MQQAAPRTVVCVLAIEDRTRLEKEITLGPEVQCKRSFLDLVAAELGVAPLSDDCVIEIPALGMLEDIASLDDGDTVEITGRLAVEVASSPSGFVHVLPAPVEELRQEVAMRISEETARTTKIPYVLEAPLPATTGAAAAAFRSSPPVGHPEVQPKSSRQRATAESKLEVDHSFVEVTTPQLTYRTRNPFNSCTVPTPNGPVSNPSKAMRPLLIEAGLIPDEVQDIGIQRVDPSLGFIDERTEADLRGLGTSFVMKAEDLQKAFATGEHVLVRPRKWVELFVHCLVQQDDGSTHYVGHPQSVMIPANSDFHQFQETVARLQEVPHVLKHLLAVPDNMLRQGCLAAQPAQLERLPQLASCPAIASHICAMFEIHDEFDLVIEGSRVYNPLPPLSEKGDKLVVVNRLHYRTVASVQVLLNEQSPFPAGTSYRILDAAGKREVDDATFRTLFRSADEPRRLVARAEDFKPILLRDATTDCARPFTLRDADWEGVLEQFRICLDFADDEELEVQVVFQQRRVAVTSATRIFAGDEVIVKVKGAASSPTTPQLPVAASWNKAHASPDAKVQTQLTKSLHSSDAAIPSRADLEFKAATPAPTTPGNRDGVTIIVENSRFLQPPGRGDQVVTTSWQQISSPKDLRTVLRRQSLFPLDAEYEFRTEDGIFADEERLHTLLRKATGALTLSARATSHKPVILLNEANNTTVPFLLGGSASWRETLQEIGSVLGIPRDSVVEMVVNTPRGKSERISSSDMVLPGDTVHVRHRPGGAADSPDKSASTKGSSQRAQTTPTKAAADGRAGSSTAVTLVVAVEGIHRAPTQVVLECSRSTLLHDVHRSIQRQVGLWTNDGTKVVWDVYRTGKFIQLTVSCLRHLAAGKLSHPTTEAPVRASDGPISCRVEATPVGAFFVPIHYGNRPVMIFLVERTARWSVLLDACREHWSIPEDTPFIVCGREEPRMQITSCLALLPGEALEVQITARLEGAAESKQSEVISIAHATRPTTTPQEPQQPSSKLEIDATLSDLEREIFVALREIGLEDATSAHAKHLSKFSSTVDGAVMHALSDWEKMKRQVEESSASSSANPPAATVPSSARQQQQQSAQQQQHIPPPSELLQLQLERPHWRALIQEIIDLRLYEEYSVGQLHEALRRTSSLDGVFNYLAGESAAGAEQGPLLQCKICYSPDLPVDVMYTLSCVHAHKFCFECLLAHIRHALTASNDSAAHIPACPCENEEGPNGANPCHYLITAEEAEQIVEMNYAHELRTNGRSNVGSEGRTLVDTLRKLWMVKGLRDGGAIRCPNCEGGIADGFWFIPGTNSMKVTCPRCRAEFCSHCSRMPYHYHIPCDDVMQVNRDWLQWLQEGRQEYMEVVARQNAQYREIMTDYQRKVQQHQNEEREVAARYDELVRDEQFKAQHCKRCPNCQRVVQKLDGCDVMVCGTDAHGGNVQNGCGHRFNWSTAPRYEADVGTRRAVALDATPPEEIAQVQHMIAPGEPLPCDQCHEAIVGPMLRCVNCPAFVICLQCHMQRNRHPANHIFQVITEPSAQLDDDM